MEFIVSYYLIDLYFNMDSKYGDSARSLKERMTLSFGFPLVGLTQLFFWRSKFICKGLLIGGFAGRSAQGVEKKQLFVTFYNLFLFNVLEKQQRYSP